MADQKKGMLADLLDGTFRTLSRTWQISLLLGGILFIPTSFFVGWASGRLFDAIGSIEYRLAEGPLATLSALGLAYLLLFAAALAQGLVQLLVRACVTEQTARAARGESSVPLGVIPYILRRRYARLLGQRVLQLAIIGVTAGGFVLIASIAAGIATALGAPTIGGLFVAVCMLLAYAAALWLSVRFAVTLESVVVEDVRIEQSLDRSAFLVRGVFWRVLGCILLFTIMWGFASSLIGTPVIFFASLREYAQLLDSLLRGDAGSGDLNARLMSLLAGMGRKLGVLAYIRSILWAFVMPVFMTLMFLELRKRKETPVEIPAAEPSPAAFPASQADQ